MPLNMMRNQRVTPDCHPPANGRKLYMRSFRDDHDHDHDEDDDPQPSKAPRFDGGGKPLLPRQSSAAAQDRVFPTPYPTEPPTHLENHPPKRVVFGGGGGGCDVLPQWGQNKRSRGPRSERSGSGDDHFSGGRQAKGSRRTISAFVMKKSTATMNPPAQTYGRARALASLMERDNVDGVSHRRAIEERTAATTSISGVFTRQEKRLSPPSPSDKMRKTTQTPAAITSAANGSSHVDSRYAISTTHSSEQEAAAAPAAPMATEKLNLDLFEWPRIYISLSRKEKEDDFLAMKGTKLPQRPKKRAKNIDKNLQYCFPGMWLSDLTKGRYEVREKKCAKKKKRGLKGMEIMESDSD